MIHEAKYGREPGHPGHNIDEAARAAHERKPTKMKTFNEERGVWNDPYTGTAICKHCGAELRIKPELRPYRCTCRATLMPCGACKYTKPTCPKGHGRKCPYGEMAPYEAVSIVRVR